MSRPKGSKNKKTLEKEQVKALKINSTIVSDNPTDTKVVDIPADTIDTPTTSVSRSSKKLPTYPTCSRCNTVIYTTPNHLNLTYLTSVASWHRDLASDQVVLCRECALGISNLINDYLIKGGCKTKY